MVKALKALGGAGILALIALSTVAVCRFVVWPDRPRRPIIGCIVGLDSVFFCIRHYAMEHGGRLPDCLAEVDAKPASLLCPVAERFRDAGQITLGSDYVYVGGGLEWGEIPSPEKTPLLFDRLGNHPSGTRTVVFCDGSYTVMEEVEFQRVLREAVSAGHYGREVEKLFRWQLEHRGVR